MQLSPCGIACEECHLKETCGGGCHAIKGKPFYLQDFGMEVCPLYDCPVNKKGFMTCGECPELPCQLFYDWKDPEMTEEAHLQSVKDRTDALKAK